MAGADVERMDERMERMDAHVEMGTRDAKKLT